MKARSCRHDTDTFYCLLRKAVNSDEVPFKDERLTYSVVKEDGSLFHFLRGTLSPSGTSSISFCRETTKACYSKFMPRAERHVGEIQAKDGGE